MDSFLLFPLIVILGGKEIFLFKRITEEKVSCISSVPISLKSMIVQSAPITSFGRILSFLPAWILIYNVSDVTVFFSYGTDRSQMYDSSSVSGVLSVVKALICCSSFPIRIVVPLSP